MAFLTFQAIEVILPLLDALLATRDTISSATRQQIEGLVRQHGPGIATVSAWDAPSRIAAFLDDLVVLRPVLPPAVAAALAGEASSTARRGMPSLSAEQRQPLLDRLVRLHDFRAFDDPDGLAAQVTALVSRYLDRLADDERAAWEKLVAAYSRTHDAGAFLREAERLLADYPAVRQLFDGRRRWAPAPTYRSLEGVAIPKGIRGEEVAYAAAAEPGDAPGEVVRYANVNFPNKVLVTQQMAPLVVHIAARHAAKGVFTAEASRMTLRVGDLTVVVFAEGFEVAQSIGGQQGASGPGERIVAVRSDGQDSEPLVFFLNPQSVGQKKITIDLYQMGVRLLSLSFTAEVVADLAALNDLSNVALAPVAVSSPDRDERLPPPDLELRVMLSADQRTLTYILHSPGAEGYHFKQVGAVTLTAEPRAFLKPTFDRLNTLARQSAQGRTAAQTEAALRELADIGINLWDQLLPPAFKAEYYDPAKPNKGIRAKYAGKGLLITSDDPWIPWEMVRPYKADEDGEELYSDPPLCEQFQLTRWLAGRGTPDRVRMQQGVWVAPPDNLKAAQKETEYFQELHRRKWQVQMTGPLSALAEVDARFRDGGTHLFHFACHGNFNTEDPNESKLKLAGEFLRPSQISGQSQAGLRKAKPVVFLNACHSGQVGIGLTGLGGWAERFLEAGASAFIGALWEANDVLAAQFAQEFYDRLWGLAAFEGKRQPLGQAFHEARMAIKQADPANPTWLAYVLYGDPYGQVVLGGA